MKAPVPNDEKARLEALRKYGLLDTVPEQEFNDLTELAALICGTPMSTVTFVDSGRQWFKASIGLAACETPRDISFCTHAIMGTDLLVVPDTTADGRFAGSPLVNEEPHIRFYAGMPLITRDGHAVGALCVLDTVPRELTQQQQDALRRLARQTVFLLEARRAANELEHSTSERERFFTLSLDMLWILDTAGKFRRVNPAIKDVLGFTPEEVVGTSALDYLHPEDRAASEETLGQLAHGVPIVNYVNRFRCSDGSYKSILWVTAPQDDFFYAAGRDITERLRVEEAAHESQRFLQSTLDALESHIAVLDETGTVAAVNKAWRKFTEENAGSSVSCGVGANYIEACTSVVGDSDAEADSVAQGIRAVMAGRESSFSLEYPCHSPTEQRWFNANVTRFTGDGPLRIVVAHENITERKQAEERIRASEAHLAVAQEVAHLGSWQIDLVNTQDLATNPTWWSDEVYRILGFEPGEVDASYRSFYEAVHPDDRKSVDSIITEAIQVGAAYRLEHRIVRPDGTVRVVRRQSEVVLDELSGRPLKIVGTIQDITEQKETEDSLLQSGELLRAVTEGTTDAIFAKDLQGRYLMINAAGARFLDRGVDEIVGKTDGDLIPSAAAEAFRESDRQVMAGGEVQTHEETGTIGGVTRTYLATKGPLRGRGGEVVGLVGVARDITERKLQELALRESETRYRALAEAAPDDVFIVDREGKHLYINNHAAGKFGRPAQELEGKTVNELFPPQIAENNASAIRRVLQTGVPEYDEARQTFQDEHFWQGTWFVPLRDANDTVTGVMGVSRDITEHKEAERTLRASEERYRSLFESNPQPMWVYDAETLRFLAVNDAAVIHYGYTRDEFLSISVAEIRHPDDRIALEVLLSKDATPAGSQGTWRHCKKDGTVFSVDLSVHALSFEDRPARLVLAQDVTERNLAEERIRNSERSLASAQAIAHVGSWEIDLTSLEDLRLNPRRWSEEVFRIFGYSPGEIEVSYESFVQAVHPEDREFVTAALRESARGGKPYEVEHRILWPDGSVHFVHQRSETKFDESSHKPLMIVGTVQDITERKRNEEELAVFAAIVGSSHDAIISKTPQGIITSWNKGAENLFGYSRAEAVGQPITMLIPPERMSEEPMILAKLARGEGVEHFETVRIHKDGHPINISVTLSPIKDSQGRIVGISKIARDITERKLTEEALRGNEARFAGIVNAAMDAIISVDDSHRIVLFNPAAERMFGHAGEAVIGRPLEVLIPPQFRAGHAGHIRNFGQKGVTSRKMGALGALSGLHADGTEFPIEASISKVEIGRQQLFTVILRDITERRQAEAQLRERAEFQRALLENFPNGAVVVFDHELRIVLAEGSALTTIGVSSEQLVGRKLDEAMGAEYAAFSLPFYRRVLDGESVEFERMTGGRVMQVSAVPLHDAVGQVSNVLVVSHDITERKEAEDGLRRMRDELEARVEERTFSLAQSNEELEAQMAVRRRAEEEVLRGREELQNFLDAMSTLAAKVAPDGTILFANEVAFAATGMSLEEYYATNFLDGPWWSFDPAVQARVRQAFATALSGTPVMYDEQIQIFGRLLTLNFGLVPIKDDDGNVNYLIAEGRDITELKSAEEALRAAEQMLQLVINQIPQAIFWKDRDSVFLGGNMRLAADAGLASPDELIGKTDREMPWAQLADDYQADDRAVMRSDTAKLNIEEMLLKADGSPAWLRTNKIPLHDRDENVVGVLASYEDITVQKEAEAALIEARREADAANLAKSEFLSRMSHELRTPLNAILGFGQILEKQELPALANESVGYILKGGKHLLSLINEVLDIARVEAGRIELSLEPIALDDVVPEACMLVAPLAAERAIELRVDAASNAHMHVLADRQRLKQVLINLLSNAIKYNIEGGTVRVKCLAGADGWTSIAVSDTGPGIAPLDMMKIFIPFERLNAGETDVEGTGLGLALSQRLVAAMGGTLGVESTVGQGSAFTIALPSTAAPQLEMSSSPEVVPDSAPRDGSRRYSVLCVEDNPSNLRLLEMLLADRPDITLLTAIQGSIGLDLARKHEPDVILLDLNLPDIGGRDVLLRLQQSALTRDIPVVIVSADATPSQIDKLLATGARAYLTKPLDIDQFLQVLDEFLHEDEGDGGVEAS